VLTFSLVENPKLCLLLETSLLSCNNYIYDEGAFCLRGAFAVNYTMKLLGFDENISISSFR
jgi:hypothetical protein